MTCAQGLLRLLWGGGPEVGVLRDWAFDCITKDNLPLNLFFCMLTVFYQPRSVDKKASFLSPD